MKVIFIFILIILIFCLKDDFRYVMDVNFSKYESLYVDITKNNTINKKILIYSADNRKDEYLKLHQEGWNKYCNIHGYKFIFEHPCKEVPLFYCKFFKILEFMDKYPTFDYYVWVDSDTIPNKSFYNFNLESMIEQIGEDADVITTYYSEPLFKALIGSFYVFKNSPNSKKILQNCLDYINYDKWGNYQKANATYGGKEYEEAAMFYSIKKEPQVKHKRIKGDFITNSYVCDENYFIIHNPMKKDLVQCFKKLLD